MKLYLSSYRLGNDAVRLGRLVSGEKRIGVVRNALDYSDDVKRLDEGRAREFDDLRSLGLHPEEVDLRRYFGAPDILRDVVNQLDALWVVGGNTFILRRAIKGRAIKESGLDKILLEQDGSFVYAGYSAGACAVTPTLRGIHLVDEPETVPAGYRKEVVWEGLGLVPFSVVPHYRSDHPESNANEEVVTFFLEQKLPFIVLRDGEVYIRE